MDSATPLREVNIEITRRCYQDCVHCSSSAGPNAIEFLSKEVLIRLLDEIQLLGGEVIQISGGEPLLHENVFEFIMECKERGFGVELFTCGRTTDGSGGIAIDDVVRELSTNRPDKVVISLQGANEETHDSIVRTHGSFQSSTTLAKRLLQDDHQVEVHFVPMTPNLDELEDLVDFGAQLGVHKVGILRFVPQGRGAENKEHLLLSSEEVAALVETLTRLKGRKDICVGVGSHLDFTFIHDDSEPKNCEAGISKCLVETNGNVVPCAVFKGQPNYVADNIRSASLQDIWNNSEVFHTLRRFDYELLKGQCAGCQFLIKCQGRCPGQRMYDWGDLYRGPDKCCPIQYYKKAGKQAAKIDAGR